jgi:hypothetical protein
MKKIAKKKNLNSFIEGDFQAIVPLNIKYNLSNLSRIIIYIVVRGGQQRVKVEGGQSWLRNGRRWEGW